MNRTKEIEELANKEHESWSNWMQYLFDVSNENSVGQVIIPPEYVERWKRQVKTPYSELSEREKESDRKEVYKIIPIIEKSESHIKQELIAEIKKRIEKYECYYEHNNFCMDKKDFDEILDSI